MSCFKQGGEDKMVLKFYRIEEFCKVIEYSRPW